MKEVNNPKETKSIVPYTFDIRNSKLYPILSPVVNLLRKRYYKVNRAWRNIPYASVSPSQKLDIYLPSTGDGPFPVVIWIHGGGWFAGEKDDFQLIKQLKVLKRGYALVSVNYRLSGEAIFPAQIHDIKAAVRWIRTNSKQYSLDSSKIAAWGCSAGGHLASLAGTSDGVKELEDLSLGNPDESSKIQAVIDWYGPMNLLTMDLQLEQSGFNAWHNFPDTPESQLVGGHVLEHQDLIEKLNPMNYISVESAPFLIEHGLKDRIVSMQQSVLLYEKLSAAIGPDKVTLRLLNAGHGDLQKCPGLLVCGPFTCGKNMNIVLDFLDRHLK